MSSLIRAAIISSSSKRSISALVKRNLYSTTRSGTSFFTDLVNVSNINYNSSLRQNSIFPKRGQLSTKEKLPLLINYLQRMIWTGITIPDNNGILNYSSLKKEGHRGVEEEIIRQSNEDDLDQFSPLLQPSSSSNNNYSNSNNKKPNSLIDRAVVKAKELFLEYGFLGIGVYCFTSAVSIGGFYVLIKNGLDIKRIFDYFNISLGTFWDSAGTIAMAYAIHKLILPIRIAITIYLTRFLKRILHK